MKNKNKLFRIIAIGVLITIGISACATFGKPKEMDAETLALKETFDNATWEVIPMSKNFPSTQGFRSADKREISAFQTISAIQNAESFRWYALSAPELSGTYYYFRKTDTGSILAGPRIDLYKSTTIDAETFASRTAFSSATWQANAMPNQPSTAGLEKLSEHGMEGTFFGNVLSSSVSAEERYEKWYSFTAPEMSGVIYYYFEKRPAAVSIGETKTIYKGNR